MAFLIAFPMTKNLRRPGDERWAERREERAGVVL